MRIGRPTIIGASPPMKRVFETVRKVAASESTVLITGESGTGKELVARSIHAESPRAEGPFIPINCAAIPTELLERELFGHEKGAFTGAVRPRPGRFELAHGGTLFLDEIGEMSPLLQVKLLRVLQERSFERVGGTRSIQVDVRIIAATNRDLEAEVKEGRFREDLYWRLNVIPIEIPPLRMRREDIPLLVDHFLERFASRNGRPGPSIKPEAMRALLDYPWPGNVRELENLLERLTVLAEGPAIGLEDLPPRILGGDGSDPLLTQPMFSLPEGGLKLQEEVARLERCLIQQALQRAGGVKKRAADLLGMKRTTLIEKMKKLGMMEAPGVSHKRRSRKGPRIRVDD